MAMMGTGEEDHDHKKTKNKDKNKKIFNIVKYNRNKKKAAYQMK